MKKLIQQLAEGGLWRGPQAEAAVASYEAVLGVSFPEDYRDFLLKFGSGHKNGVEIAGIDPVPGSDFNVVGRTVLQRRSYRFFPQQAVFFSDTGDGGQIYLNPATGEVGEVFAEPPKGVTDRIVAGSFLEFLKQRFG